MPALVFTRESSLRSLQLENEALRRQLRQTHVDVARLLQPPPLPRKAKGDRGVEAEKNSSGSRHGDAEHIERLERRCELLATRLVSIVRDRQLSECVEVHFLLRTQEEERRFLRDALLTLLRRQKQGTTGEVYGGPMDDEIHPSMLSALIMQVYEGIQHTESQLKLEQTERLLLLEQIADLILDIQQAVEKAARWVYDYHCEFLHTDLLRQMTRCKEPHNVGTSKLLSLTDATPDCQSGSSLHVGGGHRAERRWRGGVDGLMELPPTSVHEAAGAATLLTQEGGDLLEACDVLRACYRALAGVRTLLREAMSTLTPSLTSQPGKLTQVEELVKGFYRELQEMRQSNEKDRETLVRRLEAEIEAHRFTVQKYEARLKLAERELIDHLTSATSVPRDALVSSDAFAFFKHSGNEEEDGNGDTGAATPPSPPRTSAKAAAAIDQHAVRGADTIRRQCTMERVAAPSQRGDVKVLLERDKDNPQKRREVPYPVARRNGTVANAYPSAFSLSPAPTAAVAQPSPEMWLQQRATSQSLSSLDTLHDGMGDDSTGEGSVAHSPPPSPLSSRKGRRPRRGEIREGRTVVSSQQQLRRRPRAILLSPLPF
ncbi:hypothetical protein TraAM80_07049 [Trypanosoma rangeli]|uniref:Uncharacterized protein n=1 Tax=Trypanosoma rangeli TaxID=5698 RepID=A0A3S5IQN7_TRYRA|nr:uncharacterized protein TraAM80_07049 [Trypanosoma rangeli]RNF01398.1 hypothetical protein TraAM80_07049 [Trypanosoma rangeli]|eukprot:RNF01398.1 hypothetical protein TraAM80_07049 [Trypanosoma rangeli]